MKTCTKCGESKPLDQYHRNGRAHDGRKSHCKACVLAREALRRTRPEVKARSAEWHAEYYADNRERLLARVAEYQSRPEVKARLADYRSTKSHIFWESDYRARVEKYGYGHLIPSMQSFTRDELIAKYGGECAHCGGPFEQLDHWPVPVTRGGVHSLDNCVPSCKACNQRSWRQDV